MRLMKLEQKGMNSPARSRLPKPQNKLPRAPDPVGSGGRSPAEAPSEGVGSGTAVIKREAPRAGTGQGTDGRIPGLGVSRIQVVTLEMRINREATVKGGRSVITLIHKSSEAEASLNTIQGI